MAKAGDVIENPFTGERVTFLKTARETNGELLRFEYTVPPGWFVPEHVHPRQEERHKVLSGTLRGCVGGEEQNYKEGQRVVGSAGVPHAWRNLSDHEELRIVSELQPVLHMETILETGFGILRDWKSNKRATLKHLLRAAVLISEVKDDFYFTGVPMPVWKTLLVPFGGLAFVGRRLGYGSGHPRHGGPE